MELHWSKKPGLFRDNFDPKESKSWSTIFLKFFPSNGLQPVLFEPTKNYLEEYIMWGELL
jgi:hypothetical protein